MTELLTAAQMRAIEQAAIDSGEVSGLELMERAGRGVVEAIFEEWPAFARDAMPVRGPAPAPREYLVQEEEVFCGPWCCAGRGTMGGTGLLWRGCCRNRAGRCRFSSMVIRRNCRLTRSEL